MNGKRLGLQEIALDEVVLSKHNPRVIDPKDPAVKELAESIKSSGLLQPVVMRPLGDKFELLAGARRFTAHRLLERPTIMAIVRELSDAEAIRVTVLENLQRENLTPMEEARGVKELLDTGATFQAIAEDVGRSVAWVARRKALLVLAPEWRRALESGKTTLAHAELVCGYPVDVQKRIMKDMQWCVSKGPASALRDMLAKESRLLSSAQWDLDDMTLGPAMACSACKHTSTAQPELFGGGDAKARCLDPECWSARLKAWIVRTTVEERQKHPNLLVVATAYDPMVDHHQGVLRHYDFEKVKKEGPGVAPALVVAGPGQGKVILVRPHGSRVAAAANRGGDGKIPLAERRRQLAMRRKAWVVNRIARELERSTLDRDDVVCPVTCDQLLGLAALFGTYERREYAHPEDWKNLEAAIKNPLPRLWPSVAGVLRKRMRIWQVQECENMYREAIEIAKLLQMPETEEQLLGLAAVALKEPAIWALEEKAAAAEKKAAKAGAKKASKGKTVGKVKKVA